MIGPDELEWLDGDLLHEDNGCPVCCAEPGSLCSYEDPDPTGAGFGIERGDIVHADRIGYNEPQDSAQAPEVGA